MKIGIIQAASQKDKNQLLYDTVKHAVGRYGHEAINFGVFGEERGNSSGLPNGKEVFPEGVSYIETAINISFLLSARAIDFIVTGCSSGQGMMLACNSLPGVLCGYAPTPHDAFLFGRINAGNAVSLPLGLNFGWAAEVNLQCTIEKLFDGPFGMGYPAKDAERKRRDTLLLKQINRSSKRSWAELMDKMDPQILRRAFGNRLVYDYIMKYGTDEKQKELLFAKQQILL